MQAACFTAALTAAPGHRFLPRSKSSRVRVSRHKTLIAYAGVKVNRITKFFRNVSCAGFHIRICMTPDKN